MIHYTSTYKQPPKQLKIFSFRFTSALPFSPFLLNFLKQFRAYNSR